MEGAVRGRSVALGAGPARVAPDSFPPIRDRQSDIANQPVAMDVADRLSCARVDNTVTDLTSTIAPSPIVKDGSK